MTNLISNPSFTRFTVSSNVYTFTSWTSTNAILSPNTQEYLFNATSLQVSATSTSTSVTSNSVANVAGSGTYTASIYVRVPTSEPETTFVLSLETYDSGNTLDQTFTASSQKISPSSGWVRLELTATFDGTASSAKIKLEASDTESGRVFLLDGAQLVSGYSPTEFDFIEPLDQGQERAIINKALSKVPFPHLTGVELNADIQLGEFIFNTVDASGVAYVITGMSGLLAQPETEYSDEVSRGFYADGDYDVRGRYAARFITLTGSILPPDRTYVTNARQKLVKAMDLVYKGAWLKLKPAGEEEKAVFVRLSGQPELDVVNPRGRIEFSIGLKAADPLIYEWNSDREDGYTVVSAVASNFDGSQIGEVTARNIGNYRAPAIFDIRGPIRGDFATLFNFANAELIRIVEPLRSERYYLIAQKEMYDYTATLKFANPHDLIPGDSIIVSMPETVVLANVSRQDTNSYAVIETVGDGVFGFSNGDAVSISGLPATNSANTLNGTWTVSDANTTANTFTILTNASTAIATTNASPGVAFNVTNDRFNGDQLVTEVVDAFTVSYPVTYRETYNLQNVSGANVVLGRSVAFRDAEHLEIDTKEQEIALNGDASLQRGKIDAISDWIRLEPGNNTLLLDDSVQTPTYVETRAITASGVATLGLVQPHSYIVGDNLGVADVANNYDTRGRTEISNYSRTGTTVTATATSHGYVNNDVVVLRGLGNSLDGQYSVTNVNANAFTFVTNSSGTIFSTSVEAVGKKIITIANYSRTNSLVTVSTTSAHAINANTAIYVSGISEDFDGQWYASSVTSGATNTLTYNTAIRFTQDYPLTTAPSGAQLAQRFPVTAVTDYTVTYETALNGLTPETTNNFGVVSSVDGQRFEAITRVSRTSNVATLTTRHRHSYEAGDFITVEGSEQAGFHVFPGNAKKIASWSVAGNTFTVTTANTHGFVANDTVVIYDVRTASFIDITGQYEVVSVNASANTFTFNAASAITTSYNVASRTLSNNVARLTLSSVPEFSLAYPSFTGGYDLPTRITVANVNSTFDGTFDVVGVNTDTNVVLYRVTASDVAPTLDDRGGTLDAGFTTNTGTGADSGVSAIALQSDEKIVIGGASTFNGTTVNNIARLSSAGVLDTTFTTNTGTGANAAVQAIAIQSDDKIVIGGHFTTFNGTTVNRIARLSSAGVLDTTFDTNTGTGANAVVSAIALQSDGKIVLGGGFVTFNGTTVNRIARLSSAGVLDTTFDTNTGTGTNGTVYAIAIQSDDKILLGGGFTTFSGTTVNRIARLNADGTRDTAFTTSAGTGANSDVYAIALQSDGKILLGGDFTAFNGTTANKIVRLNSDGSLDTTFTNNTGTGAGAGGADDVYVIAVQSDGKILLGGQYTTFNGTTVNYIARLNSDGTSDTTFDTNTGTGANNYVTAIAIQPNGQILLGGNFTTFNGTTVNRIARLDTSGTVTVIFDNTPDRGRVYRKVELVYYTINSQTGNTEATHALANGATAGTTVYMKTLNDHGFTTGDTVDISGLSSIIDGYHEITNVSATMFKTTIDTSTLVAHQNARIIRPRACTIATVITNNHGYVAGDYLYLVANANASVLVTGNYQVQAVPDSNSYQINTAISLSTSLDTLGHKVLRLQQGAFAVEQYPVLADPPPTDYTFSYKNQNATSTVAVTNVSDTAGEVVLNSDASMKAYYRSAWIG